MAALVTIFGGSGFIGKNIVTSLAKAGFRIRVCCRNTMTALDLKPAGDVGQIQVVRCDVRKEKDIAYALEGATIVVNLIGVLTSKPGQSFDLMHRQVTETIATIAKEKAITQFVQISAIGASEKSESAYARSKASAEETLKRLIPTATIVRPSLVFGAGDGFFNLIANQLKIFPVMPAIGGAKTRFQPVFVNDVADAVAKILTTPLAQGKTYELGGPKIYRFSELIHYVGAQTHNPKPLVYMPFMVARLIGLAGDMINLTPFPALLTNDQVTLLKSDNVVSAGALTLKDLGITPTALELIAPDYLWRYRKGGQFATKTA